MTRTMQVDFQFANDDSGGFWLILHSDGRPFYKKRFSNAADREEAYQSVIEMLKKRYSFQSTEKTDGQKTNGQEIKTVEIKT